MARRRTIAELSDDDEAFTVGTTPAKKAKKIKSRPEQVKDSVKDVKSKKVKSGQRELTKDEESSVDLNPTVSAGLKALGDEENQIGSSKRFSLWKAAKLMKVLPFKLTSGDQALAFKGIGPSIASKIDALISGETIERDDDEESAYIREKSKELMAVYGMSAVKAGELVRDGVNNIADLALRRESLSKKIQIGLKYFQDFQHPMMREDVDAIMVKVQCAVNTIADDMKLVVVGDYRLGHTHCEDIEVLVAKKSTSNISWFELFAEKIVDQSFVTDTISMTKQHIDIVIKLPERPSKESNKTSSNSPAEKVKSDTKKNTVENISLEKSAETNLPSFSFSMAKASTEKSSEKSSILPDLFRHPEHIIPKASVSRLPPSSAQLPKKKIAPQTLDLLFLHRRMRFVAVPLHSLPIRMIMHTGPKQFVDQLKQTAIAAGFSLTDKMLKAPVNDDDDDDGAHDGKKPMKNIEVKSEEDVFTALRLAFVEPQNRTTFSLTKLLEQ